MIGAASRISRPVWLLMAAVAILGGCADKIPAPVTAKPASTPRLVGKVGKPYQIKGVWYTPRHEPDYDKTGVASWYGPGFHGRPTATGERYDMNDLTAAHTTLPLPTVVHVTNLENGRSLKLRVNDRGPFIDGRIIDVSRRAAQLLGFDQSGVAEVRVKVIDDDGFEIARQDPLVASRSTPAPPPAVPAAAPAPAPVTRTVVAVAVADTGMQPETASAAATQPLAGAADEGSVFVQAGAFSDYRNAETVSQRLRELGPVRVSPIRLETGDVFRVRLGPVGSVSEAERLMLAARDAGFPGSRVVVE